MSFTRAVEELETKDDKSKNPCFRTYARLMQTIERTIVKPDSLVADKVLTTAGDAIAEVENDEERCKVLSDMPELVIHSVATKTILETQYVFYEWFVQHQLNASLTFFSRIKDAATQCQTPGRNLRTAHQVAGSYEQIFQEIKEVHRECIEHHYRSKL